MTTAEVAMPARAAVLDQGRRAQVWMFVFVTTWAVVELLAGGVLRAYSPYQVVWTRYAVHLVLLLAVVGPREAATLWRTRRVGYQVARSMLMVGMPASWVVSGQLGVDGRTVMAVFWTSPLLVLALAAIVLRERAPWQVWVASTGLQAPQCWRPPVVRLTRWPAGCSRPAWRARSPSTS
ncbi:MAG: EamA family transporter [Vicinamibacterales bacterium]